MSIKSPTTSKTPKIPYLLSIVEIISIHSPLQGLLIKLLEKRLQVADSKPFICHDFAVYNYRSKKDASIAFRVASHS